MLIEAVIEKGQLRFLYPVKFVHDKFLVKVDVPEAEIAPVKQDIVQHIRVTSPNKEVAEFQGLTGALFGEGYRYVAEKSDQEILSEVLGEKYA